MLDEGTAQHTAQWGSVCTVDEDGAPLHGVATHNSQDYCSWDWFGKLDSYVYISSQYWIILYAVLKHWSYYLSLLFYSKAWGKVCCVQSLSNGWI